MTTSATYLRRDDLWPEYPGLEGAEVLGHRLGGYISPASRQRIQYRAVFGDLPGSSGAIAHHDAVDK